MRTHTQNQETIDWNQDLKEYLFGPIAWLIDNCYDEKNEIAVNDEVSPMVPKE